MNGRIIDYIKTCNTDYMGMIINEFPFLTFLLLVKNAQILQIWILILTMNKKHTSKL